MIYTDLRVDGLGMLACILIMLVFASEENIIATGFFGIVTLCFLALVVYDIFRRRK